MRFADLLSLESKWRKLEPAGERIRKIERERERERERGERERGDLPVADIDEVGAVMSK